MALAVPLIPGLAYVTASDPVAAVHACAGTCAGVIPARGYLRDPGGREGGTFWWQARHGGSRICAGMVQMWLHYPHRENAEWRWGIYRRRVLVAVIADRDYVMSAGSHLRQFTICAALARPSRSAGGRRASGAGNAQASPLVREPRVRGVPGRTLQDPPVMPADNGTGR